MNKFFALLITFAITAQLFSVNIVAEEITQYTTSSVEEQNSGDNKQAITIDLTKETPDDGKFSLFCLATVFAYVAVLPITYFLFDYKSIR